MVVICTVIDNNKPNSKENLALQLFYNRFYDLYESLLNDDFQHNHEERFCRIREIFSVYKELLGYEPIKQYLSYMKKGGRPPLESMIADELFSFIRNVLLHFPIFDTWNEVYITDELATWNKVGTIHAFLEKCTKVKIDNKGVIKYRMWVASKKKMTYVTIQLPNLYSGDKMYLKDIVEEQSGVIFCIALMRRVLDTQVVEENGTDITIMSQVYLPLKIDKDKK